MCGPPKKPQESEDAKAKEENKKPSFGDNFSTVDEILRNAAKRREQEKEEKRQAEAREGAEYFRRAEESNWREQAEERNWHKQEEWNNVQRRLRKLREGKKKWEKAQQDYYAESAKAGRDEYNQRAKANAAARNYNAALVRVSESQRQSWNTACDLFFKDKEGETPFPQPPSISCYGAKCVRGETLGVCHHTIDALLNQDADHLKKERLRWHPDKFSGKGEAHAKKAQEMFQLIQRLIDAAP